MADENLFANPIHEYYKDHGSPAMGMRFRTASVKVIAELFAVGVWDRKDGLWNGNFNLGFTYLDPLGLTPEVDGFQHDNLVLHKGGTIVSASAMIWNDLSKSKPSTALPADAYHTYPGVVFYNRWPRPDPTDRNEPAMPKPPQSEDLNGPHGARLTRACRVLEEFKAAYGPKLEGLIKSIDLQYPIDPSEFFSIAPSVLAGRKPRDLTTKFIGTVYSYDYSVDTRLLPVCSSSAGAGFSLRAHTDRYSFRFHYNRHSPKRDPSDTNAGTFHIGKGHIGMEVVLDANLEPRFIKETGAPNCLLGNRYDYALLATDQEQTAGGLARKPSIDLAYMVDKIWAEFQEVFSLKEHLARCDAIGKDKLEPVDRVLKNLEDMPPLVL